MANTPLREQEVVGSPLTQVLRRYRAQLNKTQHDIALDAWLDEAYVSRLFRGERIHPSRDALILLSVFGMGLGLEEANEVLLEADYKPLGCQSPWSLSHSSPQTLSHPVLAE